MDAAAYQRAFDREQLAILCANYDRQIGSLGVENRKLRELVRELYEDQCIDGDQWRYRDRMRELGVEA
jgi:hypothetical protein